MLDRRRHFRGRVYYGGRIAFNERHSTLDCIIRNFSEGGAKVDLAHACLLSDSIDLTVPRKGLSFRARMVWRSDDQAGFVFDACHPSHTTMTLDWALRLRASERSNRVLRRTLDSLRSEV